jgi:cold-inducible RNA-binding protein
VLILLRFYFEDVTKAAGEAATILGAFDCPATPGRDFIQPRIARSQTKEIPLKKIFVGNLDFGATEESLRSLFAPYGAVTSVNLITDRDTGRSRGFAFVEMTNGGEADKAITALNGKDVGGRALNVNEARPKEDHGGRGSKGGYR